MHLDPRGEDSAFAVRSQTRLKSTRGVGDSATLSDSVTMHVSLIPASPRGAWGLREPFAFVLRMRIQARKVGASSEAT